MSAQPDVTHLVVGSFDMLHVGHVRQLSEAARGGGRIVVGVLGDDLAQRLQGSATFMPEGERAELVAELSTVDGTEIITSTDLRPLIEARHIDSVVLEPALPGHRFETGALDVRFLPALAASSSAMLSAALTMRPRTAVEPVEPVVA